MAKVRSKGDVAIAVAFSGIAALLLAGGRTLHSKFKLPLKINETTMFGITKRKNCAMAEVIRRCKVIIRDEAPMAHKNVLECVDRSLKFILDNEQPFGGKVLVLMGDFRQVLPVIPTASRPQVVDACLNRSSLWSNIEIHHLIENERVKRQGMFVFASNDVICM